MMRTKRIAITGIDGTGKTTIIREIRKLYKDRMHEAYAFRAPQFHEDRLLPFSSLSEIIEHLSVESDRIGDATLKSVALFLSMTLYGDVERHILHAYRPALLFAERQCVVDTLAYAQFYLPLLKRDTKSAINKETLSDRILKVLTVAQLDSLNAWLKVVSQRETSANLTLNSLIQDMIQICNGQPQEIVGRMLRLYNAELPDQIVLLTTTTQDLRLRLAEKKISQGAQAQSEIHEQDGVITGLATALRSSCEFMKALHPKMRLHVIETQGLSIEQTVNAILSLK